MPPKRPQERQPKIKGRKAIEFYINPGSTPFTWRILRQQVSWSSATITKRCRDDCGNNCRKRIKSIMQLEKIGRQTLERSGTNYSKRNYEELAQIDRTIRSLVMKEYIARKSLSHLTKYRNIDLVTPADISQEIEDWIKNYFRAIQAEANTFVHSDRSICTVE